MHPPKFEIISGATLGEANLYSLTTENNRVLLDCGSMSSKSFDICLVSHAHLDHTEALPAVASKGKVLMSKETKGWLQKTGNKLTLAHIESDNVGLFKFQKKITFGDIDITPVSSGHISGSAMFVIETKKCRILYTSDFCVHTLPGVEPMMSADTLRKTFGKFDWLICESTLANYRVEENDLEENFRKLEAFAKTPGPSLIVSRRVGDLDLLFDTTPQFKYHENSGGKISHRDALHLLNAKNKIIVAGNLVKDSASAQLLESLLSNPNANIAFINGVQRRKNAIHLLRAKRRSKLKWGYFEGRLRARISGISLRNHVSQNEIIDFITTLRPPNAVLVHGPDSGRFRIARELKKHGINVSVPKSGDILDLE